MSVHGYVHVLMEAGKPVDKWVPVEEHYEHPWGCGNDQRMSAEAIYQRARKGGMARANRARREKAAERARGGE